MKRKILHLFAIVLSFSLFLSACTPRLVGEAKAQEAGLALINNVFDVNETEAQVEYEEWPGITYVNGCCAQLGTEEPRRVYIIKVNPDEIGNYDYYAEVNAVTGEAYRADKSEKLLKPMTSEQQTRADELYALEKEWSKVLTNTAEEETIPQASKWFQDKFRPDYPVLPLIWFLSEEVPDKTNMIDSEYYVVVQDGSIYMLSMVWPTLEVYSFSIVN